MKKILTSICESAYNTLKRPEQKIALRLTLEGVLVSITALSMHEINDIKRRNETNTRFPMTIDEPHEIRRAGRLPKEVCSNYSRLEIQSKNGIGEILYNGIVLGDSLGHSVRVFDCDGRTKIYDVDLKRWYF